MDPSFIREGLHLVCGLLRPREPADGRKDQDRTLDSLGSGAAVLWAIAMSIGVPSGGCRAPSFTVRDRPSNTTVPCE